LFLPPAVPIAASMCCGCVDTSDVRANVFVSYLIQPSLDLLQIHPPGPLFKVDHTLMQHNLELLVLIIVANILNNKIIHMYWTVHHMHYI